MPTEPRKSSLTGTVQWSDGTLFSGYVRVGIALPTKTDRSYATVWLNNQFPPQRLPLWYRIPIVQGQYDQTAKIYFNADLNPPSTKYVAYFYDINSNLIGGPTALFTISTGTTTLAVPTLTIPDAPVTPPTP